MDSMVTRCIPVVCRLAMRIGKQQHGKPVHLLWINFFFGKTFGHQIAQSVQRRFGILARRLD